MPSSKIFRQRIRQAIANPVLQAALDANAERRLKGRALAFASLPDWRERRQRAHAVRADVIAHLDQYLDRFVAQARDHGFILHFARNAAEAVQMVLDIVQHTKASGALVAKSKSMVSEEIELNHALQAAGHRVVETDLGEYIVQLRGERPSHIITPAVHLRRQEVGALFHEKLGIPYTEEITPLTNTARKVLREVFLTADVGISGVNFGIAETGGLCIVTNEGNGRMVTTLPSVHIALMGMERLVPTLDDLALFLSLLPRSATGQKLSVYTQILHRPLAGQQRHLILVDNGRRDLQSSSLQEALYCIRCGACLNACPVFREIGGHAYVGCDGSIAPYPGPIGSVVSPGLLGSNFTHLAQASSLCGACREACPVDIDLPTLLTRVRAGLIPEQEARSQGDSRGEGLSPFVKGGLRLYARLARSPRGFAVAQRFAWLMAALVSPFSTWMRLPAFTGWGLSKDFPRPAARSFRARWQARPSARKTEVGFTPSVAEKNASSASAPARPHPDGVEQFCAELTALGGQVIRCTDEDVTKHLVAFLREKGVERVQLAESVPGVAAADLTAAGFEVRGEAEARVAVGITAARLAIAESGSLLLASDSKDELLASLLPESHVVILRTSQIVATLAEALSDARVRKAVASVVVTGPSRTADIEMTLTIGVHGPGELCVFLIDDSKGQ